MATKERKRERERERERSVGPPLGCERDVGTKMGVLVCPAAQNA